MSDPDEECKDRRRFYRLLNLILEWEGIWLWLSVAIVGFAIWGLIHLLT